MEKIRLASAHIGDAGYAEVKQWMQCFMLASSRTYNSVATSTNRISPVTTGYDRFNPIIFDTTLSYHHQPIGPSEVNQNHQQQPFPWQVRSKATTKGPEGSLVVGSALTKSGDHNFSIIKSSSASNHNRSKLLRIMMFLFAGTCIIVPLALIRHFKIPIDATLMTRGLAAVFFAGCAYFAYLMLIKKKSRVTNKTVAFDEENETSFAPTTHANDTFKTENSIAMGSNSNANLCSSSSRSMIPPSHEGNDDSSCLEWDAQEAESPEESSVGSSDEVEFSSAHRQRNHSQSLPGTPKDCNSNNSSASNIVPFHSRGASFDLPDVSPRASLVDTTILPFDTMSTSTPSKRNISAKLAAAFPIKSSSSFNMIERKSTLKSTEQPEVHHSNSGPGSRRQKISSSIQAIFKLKGQQGQGQGSNKRNDISFIESSDDYDSKSRMSPDTTLNFSPVKVGSLIQCDKQIDEIKNNQISRSSSFGQKFNFNFKNLRKASPSHREVSPSHNLRRVEFRSDKAGISSSAQKRRKSIPADNANEVELK